RPDIIVANPPYGLSRDNQLTDAENTVLKKKFAPFLNGKPNKYMLFMAAAVTAAADGGVISMIVPNSWLGIRSAARIRTLLLQTGSLHAVTHFKQRVFRNASVEPVSFTA